MTDNEIIKALECCAFGVCRDCPFKDTACEKELDEYALALINRQKAEIEKLNISFEVIEREYDDMFAVNRNLMAEVERLKNAYKQCAWERDMFAENNKQEIEECCSVLQLEINEIKFEAYKEVIEKLKEHMCSYDLPDYHSFRAVDEDTMDEVLKEMVGN